MYQLSSIAQQVITGSHQIQVRATAYTGNQGTITNLPVAGGSVKADSTSQVRRTGTVLISDPTLWPAEAGDALSPTGSELLLEYGISIPGVGFEWVPLGQFVITDAERTQPISGSQAAVTLTLADRSTRIVEDRFDSITQVGGSNLTMVQVITNLIQGTLPTVTVTDLTGSTQICAYMDIHRDRWSEGIEPLATALYAEVFPDVFGNFVIRPIPHIDTAIPVWNVRTDATGVIVTKDEKKTRALVYNRVVCTGARSDGTPPLWAGVSDTDPTSPTRYGGPMGRKPRFYSNALFQTVTDCTNAATALLARAKGTQGTVNLTTITHPGLEPGDLFLLHDQGTVTAHMIDAVTIPLSPKDAQQITTRSLDLPPEQ